MPPKKSVFRRVLNFIRKLCKRNNKKNVADIKATNENAAASGDLLCPMVPSKGTTDERINDMIQDFIHSEESNQCYTGSVPVKRENGQTTIADKIIDLRGSIKREILNDPELENIIRNQIQDLMSEFIQGIVQNYLRESTDYSVNNISGPVKRKEDEINMNKKLTELKDLRKINDFIPPAPPLFQTPPTLPKAYNNIRNKGKVDRPTLPMNLIDEIKRGVKLKPVKPVVKVLKKPIADEKNIQGMNPLNNFIPSSPPLSRTLPTLLKVDNIKNKGKVDRLTLPMNLLDEIKRGIKLKPVKPVVIKKPMIDEKDIQRMNSLDTVMFCRSNMRPSSSSSDSSSEYFSLDEWV
ncbi:uncharacterized protein LOC126893503 isoform X2 [Daktulosphaira vitifoliae]|uniref:uncharacterized protein LOC126893503 isoform X2 n=1 Tax=Daktulosphaira vitifoliae TaxID=58002 RepID=UPI0021AA7D21|nr:uncharacterized protein LOC126893503 isoform X2 [Daktulosphaira vitifoliae]